jgi:hypothetical protein
MTASYDGIAQFQDRPGLSLKTTTVCAIKNRRDTDHSTAAAEGSCCGPTGRQPARVAYAARKTDEAARFDQCCPASGALSIKDQFGTRVAVFGEQIGSLIVTPYCFEASIASWSSSTSIP